MPIRQPIVCVLGHVDTGKTLLLDKIRKTTVQAREAGGITQHIGASFFPVDTLKQLVGAFGSVSIGEIEIPGLLVVDTPGHEAFTNLRRRGGSVADIAILVIDVLRGFETQTHECMDILKSRKTPFLVAANKIDRIPGWESHPDSSFLESYKQQGPYVQENLDNNLYDIIGDFSRLGFAADRFDHIKDFTETIAVVPTSAKTGEGITELLAVLIGLAQQYLRKRLQTTEGAAKGAVLEVKEEPGLGLTINTIIYDGILGKNDLIVVGGKKEPIVTQIRAILVPKALDEIRDPRDKFSSVNSVSAAAGVKIAAPELEGAVAGAPIYAVPPDEEPRKYAQLVSEEIERIRISTDVDGVVLKTDTLGSLEAVAQSLKRKDIPIRLADVGDVSKRDVVEADVVQKEKPLYGVVLAFNVKVLPDAEDTAETRGIRIFRENIIYRLVEDYLSWLKAERKAEREKEFQTLIMPGKVRILEDYIFRRAKPAIVGVEVLAGRIKPRYPLVRAEDGEDVGEIQQIQEKGEALPQATQGMQVAVSLDDPIVGRHIFPKDTLFVKLPEKDAKALLTKFTDRLTIEEQEALNDYVTMRRNKMPFWAA